MPWTVAYQAPPSVGFSRQEYWSGLPLPLDCKEMEISPEYSLEGLRLKLKLQHFGHLMQTTDSLEKSLIRVRIRVRLGKD